MRDSPAFTLVELLLVIALVATVSLPLGNAFITARSNQALVASAEQLSDRLRQAHIFAREAKDTKGWAIIRIDSTSYALASGTPATWEYIETYDLERDVTIPNNFRVWYEIGTGSTAPQIILVRNNHGTEKSIIIHATGVVEIEP
ncbi:MAG: prepilin-type N-terminal cleavage/methylation domain-containing protein [Patescibacteria group bacterium]